MCKHAVYTEVGLIVYSNEIQEYKANCTVYIRHKLKINFINV